MSSQAPAKVGTSGSAASNTNTSSNNKLSMALLNDSVFKAIHNAFLLGWSLMELKSRVQILGCNLSLNFISRNGNASKLIASVLDLSPAPDLIDSVLKNIVLKDVVEPENTDGSKTKENGSKPLTPEAPSLSTELRDSAWLTSVLRAIFKQIAILHAGRFPDSDTTKTIYNLPDPPQNEEGLKGYAYPYLYNFNDKFDYPNVGISSITKYNDFVKNFRLYDATRRALNCLTLLLTTPEESLEPATIKDYQEQLVQKVRATLPISTKPDSNNQKSATPNAGTASNAGQTSNNDRDQDTKIKAAIKVLSNLVIRLLEAWDSFLRESFYVDPNALTGDTDDSESPKYEIELVAYEAGRSLAALSWGVSVALAPLESTLTPEQQKDPEIIKALTEKVQNTWLNGFKDRDVNHVQHQIAALSTALDEAYYRVYKDVKQPSPDDPLAPLNPDLPSQAIQAVKHSLDYWERAIKRICVMPAETQPQNSAATNAQIQGGNAAPAQQDTTPATTNTNNQSVAGAQPPSRPLDWEKSKTLRIELIQQSTVWQSLILYQQGLRSLTVETVTQKILNDFMQNFEKAAGKEIFNNGAFRWTLGIIGVIILGIIVLIVLVVANPKLINIISSPPVIITTIVTAIAAVATPFLNGFLGKLSKIGSFFGSAGTAVEQALQNGYKQILIEFDYLNHNIGVAFPLIEFFVSEEIEFGGKPIEDGYDFLVNVFWTDEDRQEEIQRVARAAFGPIGAFVGASLKFGETPKSSQKTSQSSK